MKTNFKISFFALTIVALSACNFKVKKGWSNTAWGDIGSITIVTSKAAWTDIDTLIEKVYGAQIKGIPVAAADFTIRKGDELNFDGFLKKNYIVLFFIHSGNIEKLSTILGESLTDKVKVAIDDGKASTFTIKNIWAKPQRVQFIVAPTRDQLVEYVQHNKEILVAQAHKFETLTTIVSAVGDPDSEINFTNLMLTEQGYTVQKPDAFSHSIHGGNFNGISRQYAAKHLGIYMHSQPYVERTQFNLEYIIDLRNKIMGKHIQGADRHDSVRTYMGTDITNVVPAQKVIDLNGHYTVETRGWWTMENDYKGGPFISYTIHCPEINKIITVEGVVFGPGESDNYQPMLRKLELIISTFKVIEKKENES